jgi:hypothetical protein
VHEQPGATDVIVPAEVEQRLADTVLSRCPQRLAGVLCQLVAAAPDTGLLANRAPEIRLTHEQIAGTTRETTTKLLGDLSTAGIVGLRRGESSSSTGSDSDPQPSTADGQAASRPGSSVSAVIVCVGAVKYSG